MFLWIRPVEKYGKDVQNSFTIYFVGICWLNLYSNSELMHFFHKLNNY